VLRSHPGVVLGRHHDAHDRVRLSDSAARTFVGRREELALLRGAVADVEPPFVVAFVHGPGGIGKSRLPQAALAATSPGARALLLDCRDVEPTPRGLIRAIARGLGDPGPDAGLDGVVEALAAGPPRTVLALDTYEVFGLLDSWVRRVFVPALPDGVVTVVAGREPPAAAWLTGPGWAGLVGEVRLNALGRAHAIAMLRSLRRPSSTSSWTPSSRAPGRDARDRGGGLDRPPGDRAHPARAASSGPPCARSSTPCAGCRSSSGRRRDSCCTTSFGMPWPVTAPRATRRRMPATGGGRPPTSWSGPRAQRPQGCGRPPRTGSI
jgi:hypothetical protein